MRPGRARRIGAVVCAAALCLAAGCQRALPEWDDIASTPAAESYEGPLTEPLTTRLDGRVEERSLRVLGSRVEQLPIGEDWESHLVWRDAHDAEMSRLYERIPEPDAPVLYSEFSEANRTLFVIGIATEDRSRLVVLTALATSR